MHNFYGGKKGKKMGYFCNLQVNAQRKQSPKGRKFAQFGYSACKPFVCNETTIN
jgi:hypothetical protein